MRAFAIKSAQIRAARALLRWSAVDLARESSVGVNTIRRAEVAESETSLTAANELAIRRALETAGVEFIDENGGGPGVRLRKSVQSRAEAAQKVSPTKRFAGVWSFLRCWREPSMKRRWPGRLLTSESADEAPQIVALQSVDRSWSI